MPPAGTQVPASLVDGYCPCPPHAESPFANHSVGCSCPVVVVVVVLVGLWSLVVAGSLSVCCIAGHLTAHCEDEGLGDKSRRQ